MQVINNTTKAQSRELSTSISDMIIKRENFGHNMYPLIFMINYHKPKGGEAFIPEYKYCALTNPAEIYDATSVEDEFLYLKTVNNEHFIRLGAQKWTKRKSDLIIPLDFNVLDMEIISKDKELFLSHKPNSEEEKEKFLSLYFGPLAYRCLSYFSKPNQSSNQMNQW